jgi:hypothetical protein
MMKSLRSVKAEALPGLRLRLTLNDGAVIERDVAPLLHGPVFERIRSDPAEFARVRVEGGTVVWPDGADLLPGRPHLERPAAKTYTRSTRSGRSAPLSIVIGAPLRRIGAHI